MKKDGLAVEGEGVLEQRRQVSSVMVERSNSILVRLFFGFPQSLPQDFYTPSNNIADSYNANND